MGTSPTEMTGQCEECRVASDHEFPEITPPPQSVDDLARRVSLWNRTTPEA